MTLLLLRLVLGMTFLLHGYDKYDVNTANSMESWFIHVGLPYPAILVKLVRTFEVTGGLFVLLGLGEWAGPVMLITVMLGAIRMAHWKLNPRITAEGWEFCAHLIVSSVILIVYGFGPYSIDALLK